MALPLLVGVLSSFLGVWQLSSLHAKHLWYFDVVLPLESLSNVSLLLVGVSLPGGSLVLFASMVSCAPARPLLPFLVFALLACGAQTHFVPSSLVCSLSVPVGLPCSWRLSLLLEASLGASCRVWPFFSHVAVDFGLLICVLNRP